VGVADLTTLATRKRSFLENFMLGHLLTLFNYNGHPKINIIDA